MTIDRTRDLVAPLYLFTCLLIGGSSQGVWFIMLLELVGLLIIGWALRQHWSERSLTPLARRLWLLAIAATALVAAQLVPLPASVWIRLPGSEVARETVAALGIAPGWRPLSLTPYETLSTGLAIIPPTALLAAIIGLRSRRWDLMAGAMLLATMIGILLGVLQLGGGATGSPFYLYPITNIGVASGTFANANHMASLLLASMPFAAAIGAEMRSKRQGSGFGAVTNYGVALILIAVLLAGLLINGSLAGIGLAVPVTLASLCLLIAPILPAYRRVAIVGAVVGGVAIVVLAGFAVSGQIAGIGAGSSVISRQQILETSLVLVRSYGWLGSGLGSFQRVYGMEEPAETLGTTYVNHAHNDYLELLIETGVPGLVLMLLFLAWWGRAAFTILRSPGYGRFAQAGLIASASLLLHSMVDFPLRTAALAAVFAASLAAMVLARVSATSPDDLRPARHLTIG